MRKEILSALAELATIKSSELLWGIVVYEMVGEGCLNGIYTNNDISETYANEIARKIKETENISEYISAYIEPNEEACTGTLTIRNVQGIYSFRWLRDNSPIEYHGVGFKTGEKQLTAIYWQVK